MNQIESSAKQNRTSTSNKLDDDAALQKHKSHILAKYSQVSDEELDYDDEPESSGNALFQNTNTQDVEERERKTRDAIHEVDSPQRSFPFIYFRHFRHTRNNKTETKSMRIIRSRRTMNEKRKLNNEHKNKNVDVELIDIFL